MTHPSTPCLMEPVPLVIILPTIVPPANKTDQVLSTVHHVMLTTGLTQLIRNVMAVYHLARPVPVILFA